MLAVALSKYPDIDVDIYEAAPKFSEVGAGIGVWPRVWRILAHLGLDEDLARATALKPSYELCMFDGEISQVKFSNCLLSL